MQQSECVSPMQHQEKHLAQKPGNLQFHSYNSQNASNNLQR